MTPARTGAGAGVRGIAVGVALVLSVATVTRAQTGESPRLISPESAVALALANNLNLESARRSPEIAALNLRAADAAWAPSVQATLGHSRADSPPNNSFDRALGVLTDGQSSSLVTLNQRLHWGTSYDVGWASLSRTNNSLLNRFQTELNTTATARITQPLLRGFRIDPLRADRERSAQAHERATIELDRTVTSLTRDVRYAYAQWVYTRDLHGVAREALALARALLDGNRARVAARAMAATDVIEAEAEVARRDEAVLIAAKNVANAEDLLRLLILSPSAPDYAAPLEPTEASGLDTVAVDRDPLARALAARTDLRSRRSVAETSGVNVRQFRNDALPDLSVSAGVTARAVGGIELIREGGIGTPVVGVLERGFGPLLSDLGQLRYPGWSIQLSVGYPVGAAVARASAARAQIEQRQVALSVTALEQQVATEIRAARREVDTNGQRLQSTATAVALAERRLAAEEERFLVGLSTSFFVFQAQRDLASARIARLGAILDRRRSIADLDAIQSVPLNALR